VKVLTPTENCCFTIVSGRPGIAQNAGSCGESEGLHLVGVLTVDDDLAEDDVVGGEISGGAGGARK